MKKFLMIGAAALLMTTATGFTAYGGGVSTTEVEAESPAKLAYTKYKFNCKDFNKLDLSHNVRAKVVKSDTYKVEVTLPTELKQYLKVYVKEGKLKIRMSEDFTAKVQRKYNNWTCTTEISMPELRELELSGAAEFECDDTFDLGGKDFSLDLSGASRLKSLNVNGGDLDVEISGASSCRFAGNFRKAELDLSGAADGRMELNADDLEVDLSGAGKTKLSGDFGRISIEASGAGDIVLDGTATILEVDASGACNVRAMNIKAQDVRVEATGGSSCYLNAERSLTIEDASGAATIKYKSRKDLGVRLKSVGRAATVKRVD